ncbi:MAG: tetratricopeptide repeat protein [Vampirovibrionia bacterium]
MENKSSNMKKVVVILCIVAAIAGALFLWPATSNLTLESMLSKGQEYQKTGRTALALKVYEKAVADFPASYRAHLFLGNALLEADQPDMAKVQFDKAVELSGNSNNKFDAQIAMATMLLADKNYEKAEKLLLSVDEPRPKEVKKALADLYIDWGDVKFADNNQTEAVDKYKLAFKALEEVDVEAQQKIENKLIKTYDDMANFHLTKKELDKAIEVLNDSVSFIDNPSSHIKLAEIYKKQKKMDLAIEQYEKAYDLDTTGTAALYLGELLVDKGVDLAQKNKMDEAKECFEKAQEANPSIVIPAEIMYSLSLVSIKPDLIKNDVSDQIFPKLTLAIKNKAKYDIDSLRVQAVFMDSGNILGRAEKTIVQKDDPLAFDKTTKPFSLTCANGAVGLKKAHLIQAKIYISYGNDTDWKFARTVNLSKKSDTFSVKSAKTTGSSTSTTKTTSKPAIDKTYKPSAFDNTSNDNKPENQQVSKPALPPVNNTVVPQPIPVPVLVQPGGGTSNHALPPINRKSDEFKIE